MLTDRCQQELAFLQNPSAHITDLLDQAVSCLQAAAEALHRTDAEEHIADMLDIFRQDIDNHRQHWLIAPLAVLHPTMDRAAQPLTSTVKTGPRVYWRDSTSQRRDGVLTLQLGTLAGVKMLDGRTRSVPLPVSHEHSP
jgi:AcrR family transcriptional regulator